MLTAFTVVDQLKREYILQRQRKGIAFAKQQRKYRGRPAKEYPGFDPAVTRWCRGEITAVQAMTQLGISKTQFYRKVKRISLIG